MAIQQQGSKGTGLLRQLHLLAKINFSVFANTEGVKQSSNDGEENTGHHLISLGCHGLMGLAKME